MIVISCRTKKDGKTYVEVTKDGVLIKKTVDGENLLTDGKQKVLY